MKTNYILLPPLVAIVALLGVNTWLLSKNSKVIETVAEANKYLSDNQLSYSDPRLIKNTNLQMVAFLYSNKGKVQLYTDPQSYCDAVKTEYTDIDNDSVNEVSLHCYAGTGADSLFLYKIENGKARSLGRFDSNNADSELKDVNGDKYLDVVVNNKTTRVSQEVESTNYLWEQDSEAPGFRKQ